MNGIQTCGRTTIRIVLRNSSTRSAVAFAFAIAFKDVLKPNSFN